MTTTYTEVQGTSVLRQITGPAPGEDVTAASVGLVAQGAANGLSRKWSFPNGTYVPGDFWIVDRVATVVGGGGGTVGTVVASPGAVTVQADQLAGYPIQLPHGAVFSVFVARIDPGAHGGSYPPANFPSLTLYKMLATTGAITSIDAVTDSPASQVAYEAAHDLTLTLGSPVTIDRTLYVYYVTFTQENGANAVSGTLMPPRLTIDST